MRRIRFPTPGLTLALALALAAAAGPVRSASAAGPVRVFILSGQSNMEGKASATTLRAVIADPRTGDEFRHLRSADGWTVREDVWVTFLDRRSRRKADPAHGPLTVGFGTPKSERDETGRRVTVPGIGPELGIGWVLGDHFDEPVLLIKAAWGGRAVKYSFRPPSAMPSEERVREEVAAIQARKPDSDVTVESHRSGYGSDYRRLLSEVRRALEGLKDLFPAYDEEQGYEISGCIWFQGWNDGVGAGNPEYVEQMACFIRDLRRDLRTPGLPFVIGELGVDGTDAGGWIARFRRQQEAIAALPELRQTVRLARTASFWPTDVPDLSDEWKAFREAAGRNESKPADDPTRVDPGAYYREHWEQRYRKELSYTSDRRYHYLGSAACYYRMGRSMGEAMVELLERSESEAK